MIKQTNSVQAKHAPLLSLFLNGYENMRQKMDAPCRRPLLEIAPLVFGKWYYAALAKETILSPANLFALDLQKDSDAKIEYAYIMNTKAAEEQSDLEFTSEYHFSLMTYSTQKHPLVADLQALIGYCTPDRATDENGMLLEEEKKEILAQLSLRAEFYLEYLTRLAWLHGLLVPMPSIPRGYSLPRSVMPFSHSPQPISSFSWGNPPARLHPSASLKPWIWRTA